GGPSDMQRRLSHDFSKMRVRAWAPETMLRNFDISQPGDALEREADHVAEQVVRAPDAPTAAEVATVSNADPKSLRTKQNAEQIPSGHAGRPVAVGSTASGDQPLSPSVKAFFEPRFRHDFGAVRIHTDGRAAESACAVNALAYTSGHNIVFGAGQFAPGTRAGDRLLAHELTHVTQQQQ